VRLQTNFSAMVNIWKEVSLFSYNTFGIPATASKFVESDNAVELVHFIKTLPDPSAAILLGERLIIRTEVFGKG